MWMSGMAIRQNKMRLEKRRGTMQRSERIGDVQCNEMRSSKVSGRVGSGRGGEAKRAEGELNEVLVE